MNKTFLRLPDQGIVLQKIDKSQDSTQKLLAAFKSLEFDYRNLEHEYAVLQNEFQLYTGQTYNKISSLEKDMDQLVQQKQRTIRTMSLQIKNLKQQNMKLRTQVNILTSQLCKSQKRLKQQQADFKNTIFSLQKSQEKHRQIVKNYEKQLDLKLSQLQSIKDILNNERMKAISKDQLIINKDNEIMQLVGQLKSLNIELETQKQIQLAVKDVNIRLKKQMEELTMMVSQMEAGLRNCEDCRALKLRNNQLLKAIKAIKQKQNRRQNSFSVSKINKRTIQTEGDYQHSRFTYGRKLTDISIDNIVATRDYHQTKTAKDSVVRRCRNMLERS